MTARSVMIRSTTPAAGQRQGARRTQLRRAVLGDVLHQHDDPPRAVHEVHRAAHALDHLAGDHPVGDVPARGDLHGAEDRDVDLARRGSSRTRGRVEEARPRPDRDRLLAGVDQVGVDLVVRRVGGRPRGRRSRTAARVRRRAAGSSGRGSAGRCRGSRSCRRAAPARRVPPVCPRVRPSCSPALMGSPRAACAARCASRRPAPGVSSTTRSTKMPGRWTASGSRAPTGTSRSTSAIVTWPAAAQSGLKLRADRAEDEVAGPVADGGPDEREVGGDRLLAHELASTPRTVNRSTGFGGDATADAAVRRRTATAGHPRRPGCRPRSGCRRPRCRCPPARSRSARVPCGRELHLELAGEVLPGELLVLADVGGDHPADPAFAQQRPSPQSSTPQLLLTTSRSPRARVEQGVDQHARDAAQPEAADRERRAVRDVGDRLGGAGDHLVHVVPPARASLGRISGPGTRARRGPSPPAAGGSARC